MNEIRLVAYNDLSAQELGPALHKLVRANQGQLLKRNLVGVVDRYGESEEAAVAKVSKGQTDADPRHFAVYADNDRLIGAASLYHTLPLFHQKLRMPPLLAKRIKGSHEIIMTGPNIHAWTGEIALLGETYKQLAADQEASGGWTIEPLHSGSVVH